jgi:hypothetical protein
MKLVAFVTCALALYVFPPLVLLPLLVCLTLDIVALIRHWND